MILRRIADLIRGVGPGTAARATEGEMAVLRYLLSGIDPRYRQLLAQMTRAPEIERSHPAPDLLQVGPTSTFEDLSFPLETERIASDWVPIVDSLTGRTLEFRIVVGRHGFLRGLEGRTTDGKQWPEPWLPDFSIAARLASPLQLPSIEEQTAMQKKGVLDLRAWLDDPAAGITRVFPPALEPHIAQAELRLGGRLPTSYKEFVRISNGVDLKGSQILGLDDLHEVAHGLLPGVVVSWDSDGQDEFILALSLDGHDQAIYRLEVHDGDANPRPIAPDFREYLRHRVGSPP